MFPALSARAFNSHASRRPSSAYTGEKKVDCQKWRREEGSLSRFVRRRIEMAHRAPTMGFSRPNQAWPCCLLPLGGHFKSPEFVLSENSYPTTVSNPPLLCFINHRFSECTTNLKVKEQLLSALAACVRELASRDIATW